MPTTKVVIGIDAGGSTTRALCADLSGTALGYVETGGANPAHNADAKEHVQAAIRTVIAQAGRQLEDVVAVVAGIAGLDEPADHAWATQHTAVSG
jgi:glucosamine kinase